MISLTSAASSKATSRATTKMTIRSSKHGRQRRGVRQKSKRQLQRALKHGKRTKLRQGVTKHEHQGITFIYDYFKRREITSYVSALNMAYHDIRQSDYDAHVAAHATHRSNPTQLPSKVIQFYLSIRVVQ